MVAPLFPVVAQYYEADVNKEHVIRGNSAVIKCLIPSFVADFVEVVSWHTDEEENYFPGTEYGAIRTSSRKYTKLGLLKACPGSAYANEYTFILFQASSLLI